MLVYVAVVHWSTDNWFNSITGKIRSVAYALSLIFCIAWVYGEVFWFSAAPTHPIYGVEKTSEPTVVSIGTSNDYFIDPTPFRTLNTRWYDSTAQAQWEIRIKLYDTLPGKLYIRSNRVIHLENLAQYGLLKTQNEYDYDVRQKGGQSINDAFGVTETMDRKAYQDLARQIDKTSNEVFFLTNTEISFIPAGEGSARVQLAP